MSCNRYGVNLLGADFEQYPIWTWTDDHERLRPINELDLSTADHQGLLIKARFRSTNGCLLDGEESFFAFGLFVGDREFVMNLNMPRAMRSDLEIICRSLQCDPSTFFPIYFESDIQLEDGIAIEGVLEIPSE